MRMLGGAMLIALLAAAGCARPEPRVAAPVPSPAPPAQPETPENPVTPPAAAETPLEGAELDALFAEWRRRQEETPAITARFTCAESSALLTKPRTTSGSIQILKPDGYRRTTLDPKTGQVTGLMILKPPDLWVYLPALAEAEHYNLEALGGKADANPLKALEDIISFDAGRIRARFAIRAFREPGGLCRLEYAPLDKRAIAGVEKVRLWVRPGARFPEKMETVADGDLRVETYSEPRFDAKPDPALFKFRPPPGVKMTEVRK